MAASISLSDVQVRRNNGQCDYGPWMNVLSDDVPQWVGGLIADEMAENDADGGVVEQGGSIWTWCAIDNELPILCDYNTGKWLRNATAEETAASIEAGKHDGGSGVIEVDGCDCYVEE